MEKKFKCKTEGCIQDVVLELKKGVGTFSVNDLDKHIQVYNDEIIIDPSILLDDVRPTKKLTFHLENNSPLRLNLKKGYKAEALLRCPFGHENYYTIEVK